MPLPTSDEDRVALRAYNRAHYQVVKLWGKARQYPCVACGRSARDWAYDGTDPTGTVGHRSHSFWPEFYMPMCHQCHLRRDRKDEVVPLASLTTKCDVRHCPNDVDRKGLCWMHYRRWMRYGGTGTAGMVGKRATLEDRFLNHVQIYGPTPLHDPSLGACQIWTGYCHPSGYGAISSGHRLIYVHRLSYEWAYGPIPIAGRIKQICLNKLCVRPDHLALVPRRSRGRG